MGRTDESFRKRLEEERERIITELERLGVTMEKVVTITSGSHAAAVDLKDTVDVVDLDTKFNNLRKAIDELKSSAAPQEQVGRLEATVQQMAEDYGHLETKIQDVATRGKRTTEEVQRFAELMAPKLDMIAAVAAAKSHDSRISDLESWRKHHSSEHGATRSLAQAIWRNLIAIAALVVAVFSLLKALGWI